MKAKEGEIISLVSFSRRAGIPSGPQVYGYPKIAAAQKRH